MAAEQFELSLPSIDELSELPCRAAVAYATRCVRRVQPIFSLTRHIADHGTHKSAITTILTLAEQFCRKHVVNAFVRQILQDRTTWLIGGDKPLELADSTVWAKGLDQAEHFRLDVVFHDVLRLVVRRDHGDAYDSSRMVAGTMVLKQILGHAKPFIRCRSVDDPHPSPITPPNRLPSLFVPVHHSAVPIIRSITAPPTDSSSVIWAT